MTRTMRILVAWILPLFLAPLFARPDGLAPYFTLLRLYFLPGTVALLGLMVIGLVPIEMLLDRIGGEGAMILIAPLLGWGTPYLADLIAPHSFVMTHYLPLFITLGLSGGALWGATVLFAD